MSKKLLKELLVGLLWCLFFVSGAKAQSPARFLDVLLIIDGSGSMKWPDRDPEAVRIEGAKLFIDLCEKGVNVKYFSYPCGKDISHDHGKDISHPHGKQISHAPSE